MAETLLSEVLDKSSPVDNLYWNAGLPSGVDPERLVLNEKVFQRSRRLAGVMDVIFEVDNERTEVNVGGNMNADGSLTSARGTVKRRHAAELSHRSVNDFGTSAWDMADLPDLIIPVPNKDITESLGQSKAASFTHHYAREFNGGFRKAMLDTSIETNATSVITGPIELWQSDMPKLVKAFGGIMLAATLYITYSRTSSAVDIFTGKDQFEAIKDLATASAFGNGMAFFLKSPSKSDINGKKPDFRDYRWSLFNYGGAKLDRIAVAAGNRVLSKPLLTVKR